MNVNFDKDGAAKVTLTKAEQRAIRKVQALVENLNKFHDEPHSHEAMTRLVATYCEPEGGDND